MNAVSGGSTDVCVSMKLRLAVTIIISINYAVLDPEREIVPSGRPVR